MNILLRSILKFNTVIIERNYKMILLYSFKINLKYILRVLTIQNLSIILIHISFHNVSIILVFLLPPNFYCSWRYQREKYGKVSRLFLKRLV